MKSGITTHALRWLGAMVAGGAIAILDGWYVSGGATAALVLISSVAFALWTARANDHRGVVHAFGVVFMLALTSGLLSIGITQFADAEGRPEVFAPWPLAVLGVVIVATLWASLGGGLAWAFRRVVKKKEQML